jgi:hypothetical protein
VRRIFVIRRNDEGRRATKQMDFLQSRQDMRMRGSASAYDTSAIKLPSKVKIAPMSKIPITVG